MGNVTLSKILVDLEALLKSNDATILNKLRPGIDKFDFTAGFGGIVLPDEVRTLYAWRNGVNPSREDTIGDLSLFTMGIFLPIEKAIMLHKEATREMDWENSQFPLFESGGGEFFLIECNSKSAEYGRILYHSIGEVDFDTVISKYDSLSTLFLTIHECYLKHAYYRDNSGLNIDPDLEFKISKKNNPKSKYWKLY